MTFGRGYLRPVNGVERFYVRPSHRALFPETYEPEAMAYLRARVRPGHVSLNVGANAGLYALCLARWSGPQGRVVAFDPNPAMRDVLADTARRNALADRITIRPEAIGAEPGAAPFQVALELAGVSRLDRPNPEAAGERYRTITASVTTLDRYCAEHRLRPDWLVMDIEGYEVAALRGGRDMIRDGRGRLGMIVELHPTLWELSGTSRAELEQVLGELELRAVPLTGQADPLAAHGIVRLEPAG